ncbi:hypothetical protein AYI68_g5437 [Smittium mucronatum]|uniref:Uncharacterized protein n=1 Tax=Smittium mucronatum TaxID=133383 RepID=A0A1R0GUA4_9FUNG|nr:hypothetical protein AYI68_g5437 [Smittium mucronatum]
MKFLSSVSVLFMILSASVKGGIFNGVQNEDLSKGIDPKINQNFNKDKKIHAMDQNSGHKLRISESNNLLSLYKKIKRDSGVNGYLSENDGKPRENNEALNGFNNEQSKKLTICSSFSTGKELMRKLKDIEEDFAGILYHLNEATTTNRSKYNKELQDYLIYRYDRIETETLSSINYLNDNKKRIHKEMFDDIISYLSSYKNYVSDIKSDVKLFINNDQNIQQDTQVTIESENDRKSRLNAMDKVLVSSRSHFSNKKNKYILEKYSVFYQL